MSEPRFYTPPIPDPTKASEGTFVPNRMEGDAVMLRVSRDLYASPTAGVRELLANEITAARAARKLGADPRIEVTILDDRICVWGIDSLGMERRTFDDVYTVLGRSGNFDGTTPGQFGLGRSAYMTISDHMLLETRHRNGDRYTVLGVEGRGFQVDLGKPDIPYGTRVTLAPRDGSMAYTMAEMVRLAAGRCEIPMTLTTKDGSFPLERQALEVTIPAATIDTPDMECAVGMLVAGSDQTFLCGMPIEFNYRGKYPLDVSLDIHDERKYPPTPDRERMTEAAETAISDIIDAEIDRRLAGFPADINEALTHPDRHLAFFVRDPPDYMGVSHDMLVDGIKRRLTLIDVTSCSPILGCRVFARRHTDAVLAKHPDAVFVRDPPDGLTTVEEFMERNGIEPLPRKRAETPAKAGAVVHTSSGPMRVDPDNPPGDLTIIRVGDGYDINDNRDLTMYRGIALTMYDVAGAVSIEEHTAGERNHLFDTSDGVMTGAQLAECGRTVYRTPTRRVLEVWPEAERRAYGPLDDGIVVWNDGTEGCRRAYDKLRMFHGNLRRGFNEYGWGDDGSVEAYLLIRNPVLRRVMREFPEARRSYFYEEFLRLDGRAAVEAR